MSRIGIGRTGTCSQWFGETPCLPTWSDHLKRAELPQRCSTAHSPTEPLFFEGVLVDLFQVEGLTYLNADVVPDHQLSQLFTVDEP